MVLQTIKVIKSSENCQIIIRRISFTDLFQLDNFKKSLYQLPNCDCWILIDNNYYTNSIDESNMTEFSSHQSINNVKLVNEALKLMKTVYIENNKIKFIFTTNINADIPDQLIGMSRPLLLEFEHDYQEAMKQNLCMYMFNNNLQTVQEKSVMFILIIFHSIFQIQTEEISKFVCLNYYFNENDLLIAANLLKDCFQIHHPQLQQSEQLSEIAILFDESLINQVERKELKNGDIIIDNTVKEHVLMQLKSLIKLTYGGRIQIRKEKLFMERFFDSICNMKVVENLMKNGLVHENQFSQVNFKSIIDETEFSTNVNQYENMDMISYNVEILSKRLTDSLLSTTETFTIFKQIDMKQLLVDFNELIKFQCQTFGDNLKLYLSDKRNNNITKFIYRELMFGYHMLEELEKLSNPNQICLENANLRLEHLKSSLQTNKLHISFHDFYITNIVCFSKWIQDLCWRIENLIKLVEYNKFDFIPLDMLFHPDLFITTTKMEIITKHTLQRDDFVLYLSQSEEINIYPLWKIDVYRKRFNEVIKTLDYIKERFTLFWSTKAYGNNKYKQKACCYSNLDHLDVIFSAELLINIRDNSQTNENLDCLLYLRRD